MQALIIIDMQQEMQKRITEGRDRVNPEAGSRIAALAAEFRRRHWPVLHVRHREEDSASAFHPRSPGFQPMACAEALDDETVFFKTTSSAFASTDLEDYLRRIEVQHLVVAGAVAGFCVNSTVRAGADLGFRISLVRDAVLGFDLPQAGLSARTIFDVTMAHLEADFATLVETDDVLRARPSPSAGGR